MCEVEMDGLELQIVTEVDEREIAVVDLRTRE